MADKTYVLRDLPGIAEIEPVAKAWHLDKNREWSKHFDDFNERLDVISKRLFGITEDDAYYSEPLPDEDMASWRERQDEWEERVDWLDDVAWPDTPEIILNTLKFIHGWDVCDADGKVLACAPFFVTQIFVASQGWRGRLPGAPVSEAEMLESVERFEDKMLAEAEEFRRQRRR